MTQDHDGAQPSVQGANLEDDWLQIHQHTSLVEFSRDMRDGLTAAFFGTFAIPAIAEVLSKAGEMHHRPVKRAYDTALAIYELISSGLDSARGREVVAMLNRFHRGIDQPELFTHVLCAFIVTPIRWIDRRSWRPVTDMERAAAHRFYLELGRRMAIKEIPASWAEAAAYLDDYQRRHVGPSPAATRLLDSTVGVVRERLPQPLRPLCRQVMATYFDNPAIPQALGLPRPWLAAPLLDAMYVVRRWHRRRDPSAPPEWNFTPGREVRAVYPLGYDLSDLGPRD